MKTYAPKGLHGAQLRELVADLHATHAEVCKFLQVPERTFRRWLADDSAPYSALALLWHETATGREHTHSDVAYDLVLTRGMSRCHEANAAQAVARLGRVLAISDTGAANDPLHDGPLPWRAVAPLVAYPAPQAGKLADDGRAQDGPADDEGRLVN